MTADEKLSLVISAVVLGVLAAAVGAYVVLKDTTTGRDGSAIQPVVVGPGGVSVREANNCGKDDLPWGRPPVVKEARIENGQLNAWVLANATCGAVHPDAPYAKLEGGRVTIGWKWVTPPGGMLAACRCTRQLEFVVPGVSGPMPEIVIEVDKNGLAP